MNDVYVDGEKVDNNWLDARGAPRLPARYEWRASAFLANLIPTTGYAYVSVEVVKPGRFFSDRIMHSASELVQVSDVPEVIIDLCFEIANRNGWGGGKK